MVTKNYAQLANSLRLGAREIARRADTSHVTVLKILAGKGQPFYSTATEAKVKRVIDDEAARMRESLNKLRGFDDRGEPTAGKREAKLKRK